MSTTNKGFSIVAIVIISLAVIIIGAVGYVAYTNTIQSDSDTTESKLKVEAETINETPPITETNDLDTALENIDNLDFDSASASDGELLNSESSDF